MYELLKLRENTILFYEKYENAIIFFVKFFLGFFAIKHIADINLYSNLVANILKQQFIILYCVIFSICFYFMPTSVSYFLMLVMLSLSMSKSIEASIIVFLCLLLVLFLYARIASKESIFIFLMILGFYFKIPYLVPIIAGLYFGITSVIPITIGVFLWRAFPIVKDFVASDTSAKITGIMDLISVPQRLFTVFDTLARKLTANPQWILESLILCIVLFFVFIISRLSFNYCKETAIVLGGILNMLGFLLITLFANLNISVVYIFIISIVCIILALVIKFFDGVLNYETAQRLEFEDDEFYYFVRTIPKIKSSDFDHDSTKKEQKKAPLTLEEILNDKIKTSEENLESSNNDSKN